MASNLHEIAVNAEQSLEALATGLAHAGVDEKTTDAVTQMADVCRKIAKMLGKGQEETADNEPPEPAPQEQQPRSFDQASKEMMAERHQRPQEA